MVSLPNEDNIPALNAGLPTPSFPDIEEVIVVLTKVNAPDFVGDVCP